MKKKVGSGNALLLPTVNGIKRLYSIITGNNEKEQSNIKFVKASSLKKNK